MNDTNDIGLEDVELSDFTIEKPDEETDKKTDKKTEDNSLSGIKTFGADEVAHVYIGPNGVTLISPKAVAKYSVHTPRTSLWLGKAPTLFEMDLEQIIGITNATSKLEKELANTRAELEKVKAEFDAFKKEKDEKKPEDLPPEKDDATKKDAPEKKEEKPIEEKPEEKAKEEAAKDEKKDAAIKDEKPKDEKKEAEHSGNLADAIKLMQVAKKQGKL